MRTLNSFFVLNKDNKNGMPFAYNLMIIYSKKLYQV